MKTFRISTLAAFCLLSAACCFAQEASVERALTLEESIQTALQNNQELLSAQEGIRIAEQRVAEARSHYYPAVGVNASASRYKAEQSYVLAPEFGSTLLRPFEGEDPDNFYTAGLYMRHAIYNGGRLRNTVKLARADLEQARVRAESVRTQVVSGVTRAFYDVLLVRKERELARAAVEKAESLVTLIPSGDARRQAETVALVSRLRRRLSERMREEERAHLTFLSVLGMELYTRLGLQGELQVKPVTLDLAKLLAWAQESRLEIRVTSFQEEVNKLAVNLSQAERYPVVAFGAGYEVNDPEFPLRTERWNATLNVSLPLFDGFSSRARIRQRKLQANQSRIQRAQLEDQINTEVRQAYADVVYWQEETARRSEDLMRLEASVRRMKGADPAAGAHAQEWLLTARESYWEAVHGQRVSLARLEKSVGRPIE